MRLKHLKDANKGLRKRLERAESLLERAEWMMQDVYDHTDHPLERMEMRDVLKDKIEIFLQTPLDTH